MVRQNNLNLLRKKMCLQHVCLLYMMTPNYRLHCISKRNERMKI